MRRWSVLLLVFAVSAQLSATTIIVLPTAARVVLAADSLRSPRNNGIALDQKLVCKIIVPPKSKAAYTADGLTSAEGKVPDPNLDVHSLLRRTATDDLVASMKAMEPLVKTFLERVRPAARRNGLVPPAPGTATMRLTGIGLTPEPAAHVLEFDLTADKIDVRPIVLPPDIERVFGRAEAVVRAHTPADWPRRSDLVPVILDMMRIADENDDRTGGQVSVVELTRKGLEWKSYGECKKG